MDIPTLPITHSLPDIKRALLNGSAVLTAPPGSGKTTLVPLALLDEPWLKGRKILILQPRRIATRAACFRMASILREEPGKTVGYHIRQDRMVCNSTRIEVVTEGILTKRIQYDPELSGVGLIIFDEYHERSIHADLALALCLDLCQINEHLKILVMSATLDTQPISRLLGGAPIIEATGKCYDVRIEYYSPTTPARIAGIATAGVIKVLTEQAGDILVFLPGVGDIKATENNLNNCTECENISIQALYGNLSQREQDAILYPRISNKRRVVLATSIAETSLTIEGITNVIDSGWSKRPFFNATNGLTSLQTVRVSKSAADQRAGRAGRLGPGYCLRLWDKTTHHSLPSFHPPEIINSDLSGLALELMLWGVSDPSELLWLDPPRTASFEKATALLYALGAIDIKTNLTPLGRQLALLPLHPRLGNLLIKSQQSGNAQKGADICALLTERDVMDYRDEPSAEISLRLELLKSFRTKHSERVYQKGGRPDLCRRVDKTATLFKRSLADIAESHNPLSTGALLISAYPDRIAKRLANQLGKYLLANGRVVRLNPSDTLNHSEYLIVANMDGGQKEGRAFLAEAVDLSTLLHDHPALITSQKCVHWDQEKGKVETILRQSIGAITLQEKPLHNVDQERVKDVLIDIIQKNGLQLLDWTKKTVQLQYRVHTLREEQAEVPWPDLSTAILEKNLDWLKPYLHGVRNSSQLKRLNLYEILSTQLDYKLQQRLQRDAPEYFQVPSGSMIRINYDKSNPPILAVRVQELFGLTETPSICGGRITLLLHLLSPARRPIQITSDLKGFWENSYHDVKKDLKGRYPKHFWPDNPACASATKTTKKNIRKS
ncbi:MAG: ATP-dependent helicase HrpB [Desulforhopalus sp.]|jgi:ATP-dependent helicase HrpB